MSANSAITHVSLFCFDDVAEFTKTLGNFLDLNSLFGILQKYCPLALLASWAIGMGGKLDDLSYNVTKMHF